MSRIGNKPIIIAEQVTVVPETNLIKIKGPKGELVCPLPKRIKIKVENNQVNVTRANDQPETKALHGLTRSLINNAVKGVTKGYQKQLQLIGTGYRVSTHPEGISLTLGFSHPVVFKKIPGIDVTLEGNDKIFIAGIDKQLVGQTAANIRALRPPEPYKGKGIRYADEEVLRKPGKAAKTAASA